MKEARKWCDIGTQTHLNNVVPCCYHFFIFAGPERKKEMVIHGDVMISIEDWTTLLIVRLFLYIFLKTNVT